MVRIMWVLVLAGLVALAGACGGGDDASADETPASTAAPEWAPADRRALEAIEWGAMQVREVYAERVACEREGGAAAACAGGEARDLARLASTYATPPVVAPSDRCVAAAADEWVGMWQQAADAVAGLADERDGLAGMAAALDRLPAVEGMAAACQPGG